MELSPEEKQRIYEEEKARIEARERLEQEKRRLSQETTTGLVPNVAGLLCYIGGWITGLIFFIIEQKNNWVRFHAAQSIVTFGAITVAAIILGFIPVVGHIFGAIIWLCGFVLWIILLIKAYSGERYRLPWAGDIAERMVASSGTTSDNPQPPSPPQPAEPATPAFADVDRQIGRKIEEYFERKRGGRITASAAAIAWSIVLLIFFNFFNEYVAYYHQSEMAGGVTTWTRYPFFTSEINLWLPILTTALVVSIIGHIVLIILDRYVLREVVLTVIDVFALATVVTLLTVFPFNFSVIPNTDVAGWVHIGVTIALVVISVGIGIGIIVRVIKLIVNLAKGITSYQVSD